MNFHRFHVAMLWALALLCVGIALEGEELGIHKSLLEAAERGDATAQSLLAQALPKLFQSFFEALKRLLKKL